MTTAPHRGRGRNPGRPEDADGTAACRNCNGTAPRRSDGGGFPVGWYALTVAVPEWYAGNAGPDPYVWVGVFCQAACLLAYGPEIIRMQELARQAYEPAVPVPPAPRGTGNAPGRRGGPRP